MQVYLHDDTQFENMGVWEMQNQNKYGIMHGFNKKLDLITTEYVGDYFVYNSENGKNYFCIDNNSQMGKALGKIQETLTKENGFQFKPSKSKLYIRIDAEQAKAIPKHKNMLISVNVYGVFLQTATKLAFLQFEMTGYQPSSRIDFDAVNSDDNAVFP